MSITANLYPNARASTLDRDQVDIEIETPIIKQLDAAWSPHSPGNDRSGMRSASALANTTWHIFAISGSGRTPDILAHDSLAQSSVVAALPPGYTAYRRIGSIVRSAGAILGFAQTNDRFIWNAAALDVNVAIPNTNAQVQTLTVPIGIAVEALLRPHIQTGANSVGVLLSSLSQTDVVPNLSTGIISILPHSRYGIHCWARSDHDQHVRANPLAGGECDWHLPAQHVWLHRP